MRVLWHSNAAHVGSGYGQQTALFAPRIADAGHQLAISAFYGVTGGMTQYRGLDVYPGYADAFGSDVIGAHALHWFDGDFAGDNWIITLCDVWTLRATAVAKFNVASWTPVDHLPPPPAVFAYFQQTKAVPLAMSRFGEEQLRRIGLDPLYVPHGVDSAVMSQGDRTLGRKLLDVPEDAFLVGMVAANKGSSPSRKGFGQAFQAFTHFQTRHPDAVLYVHSDKEGVVNGVDLGMLAAACGIPDESIRFVDQYAYRVGMPASYLAHAYSAMDVLLNASYGEGFGVPIIEAQACGTPVIVSDCTSMPELVGAGWLVKGQPFWDPHQNAWLHDPSISEILSALEQALRHRGSAKLRAKALAKAAEYDADRVYAEHWTPVLEQLAERSRPKPPKLVPVSG